MNRVVILASAFFLLMSACSEELTDKPHKLVSRDRLIDILVDIHLADAAYQTRRYINEEIKNYKESDFYYSVLKKHGVADSIFEKSLIYYAGKPKDFEKIYTRVINRLNELQQEDEKKSQKPVDISNPQKE